MTILINDCLSARFPISKEEKMMYMLRGLREEYDNIFSKALQFSHESRLERIKIMQISPLPSMNMNVKSVP